MTPNLMTFALGTDRDFTIQLTTDGTTPIGSYLNTDTLSAVFWPGSTQAAYASAPAVSWVDASTATLLVSFTGGITSALPIGEHRLQVSATRSGRTVVILDCGVTLTGVAGSATALKTYCAYTDLLKYAPWIQRLNSDDDQNGFAQERNDACLWFEDLLHRHWRGGQGLAPDYYFLPGIAFGGTSFGRYATVFRSGVRSLALQTWLDSGGLNNGPGLMVTSQVTEANAAYSIARIAEKQVNPAKENAYREFSLIWYARAEAAANLITAELDTNNDGQTDTYVRLGITDTLEG